MHLHIDCDVARMTLQLPKGATKARGIPLLLYRL